MASVSKTKARKTQSGRSSRRQETEAAIGSTPSVHRNTGGHPAEPTVNQLMEQIAAATKAGDWPVAAQKARSLVQRRGSTADRRLFGFLLINAGAYKQAIAELEKLVDGRKADAEVFHRLGHAYSTQRFHEKAFDAFMTAIRLEPRNPRHYKCGATLILKAYERRSNRFRNRLALAKRWCDEARKLGATPHKLAALQRDLELYLRHF